MNESTASSNPTVSNISCLYTDTGDGGTAASLVLQAEWTVNFGSTQLAPMTISDSTTNYVGFDADIRFYNGAGPALAGHRWGCMHFDGNAKVPYSNSYNFTINSVEGVSGQPYARAVKASGHAVCGDPTYPGTVTIDVTFNPPPA